MRRSRVATAAAVLAVAGAMLVGVGPALTLSESAQPMTGFNLFMLGGLLCLLGLGIGLIALYRTRPATGLSGRGLALLAALVSGAGFLVLAVPGFQGRAYPPINDITTSPLDPPRFRAALEIEANRGRDMSYPGAEFQQQQESAYPELGPVELPVAPGTAFDLALAELEELGLAVTERDRAAGHIEAFETTGIFHFVDDVVLRIRPVPGGSRIDLRSKSRDGQGDLGANALRIQRIARQLRETSVQ